MVGFGDRRDDERLAELLGCRSVKLPIKYLGIPLGSKYREERTWDLVIEMFEKRLVG